MGETTMDTCVVMKQLPGCKVVLLGQQPRMKNGQLTNAVANADTYITKLGGDTSKRCVIVPPSNDTERGYQSIGVCNFIEPVFAEGTVLTEPQSSAVLQVADCATITIVNTETGQVLLTHAGRWALKPPECCGCTGNIVSTAFRKIVGDSSSEKLFVYITGAICPQHFRHDDEDGQELVRPFLEKFGADIFFGDLKDGCLDIVKLIKVQLVGFGIPEDHISHDGICTFEEPGLTSHREHWLQKRERVHANSVITVLER